MGNSTRKDGRRRRDSRLPTQRTCAAGYWNGGSASGRFTTNREKAGGLATDNRHEFHHERFAGRAGRAAAVPAAPSVPRTVLMFAVVVVGPRCVVSTNLLFWDGPRRVLACRCGHVSRFRAERAVPSSMWTCGAAGTFAASGHRWEPVMVAIAVAIYPIDQPGGRHHRRHGLLMSYWSAACTC